MSDYESAADVESLPLFAAPQVKSPQARTPQAKRDDCIQRAEANANDNWRQCAEQALAAVIGRGNSFTSEHVWRELESRYPDARTHEPRAMGPVILAAVRANIIVRECYVPSSRATRNSAPIAQYRVLPTAGAVSDAG